MVSDLSKVDLPISKANGLPNSHYVDESIFQKEKEILLFNKWTGVAFSKDIPNNGDALPINFLGFPLLVVRNQEGEVVVFQNICRHRGMILVNEKKNIRGTIRCPYHSWSYNLDGNLRATPHVGGPGQNAHEDINKKELGLTKINSTVYLGVIFVNISGNADPFEKVNRNLLSRWCEFDKSLFYSNTDSSFILELNCNWKLAVENYCESYHLPWVHPELNIISKLEDHYNIQKKNEFSGQGSYVYRQIEDKGKVFYDFDGLSSKWNEGAEYIAVYPNVLLGVHRDHIFSIILEPINKEFTREHVAIFYAKKESTGATFSQLRKQNFSFWKSVLKEDIFVVEGMQKGRHGKFFDGGRFSPIMDGPTHNFHNWVAKEFV
mgnify:FL=1